MSRNDAEFRFRSATAADEGPEEASLATSTASRQNQLGVESAFASVSKRLPDAIVVGGAGLELEPLCGRPSPQAKS
jgi:hypothetical protein